MWRGCPISALFVLVTSAFHLQHPLLFFPCLWFGRDFCTLMPSAGRSMLSRFCFLDRSTSSVIALNMSSTLMFSLADVSKKRMPIWWAKASASLVRTTLRAGSSFLLPTRTRFTTSQFWSISWSHLRKNNSNISSSPPLKILSVTQFFLTFWHWRKTPPRWRRRRRWHRGCRGSRWRWWCGTAPVRPCPRSEASP